ncbi:MAG: ABC transporter permease subunit [Anaerolineae bacterium]|nr:ABC transporter permease subunit [Anaerolineae bacterium]
MTGKIFVETLRRNWRIMLYWGIGMGLYGVMITVAVLDDKSLQQIMQVIETMPSFIIQGFMGGADIEFMSSADGYFAIKFFSMALLIYSLYAVTAGLAVTANDEDAGIMDVFLSMPVPRWAVMLERALAFAVMMIGVLALTYLGVLIGSMFVPQVSYDLVHIGVTFANIYPSMIFVLSMTVLFGVLFRRRSVALGVTAAVVAGSYFLDFVASGAPDSFLGTLGYLSYFRFNDGVRVMQFGLEPLNIGLLVAVAVLLLALALWRFQKRDIGL